MFTLNPGRCPKHSYQLREVQPAKRDPLNFKKFYIFTCKRCGSTIAISNVHLWYGQRAVRSYNAMMTALAHYRKGQR